jgi:hypothetical protein
LPFCPSCVILMQPESNISTCWMGLSSEKMVWRRQKRFSQASEIMVAQAEGSTSENSVNRPANAVFSLGEVWLFQTARSRFVNLSFTIACDVHEAILGASFVRLFARQQMAARHSACLASKETAEYGRVQGLPAPEWPWRSPPCRCLPAACGITA